MISKLDLIEQQLNNIQVDDPSTKKAILQALTKSKKKWQNNISINIQNNIRYKKKLAKQHKNT